MRNFFRTNVQDECRPGLVSTVAGQKKGTRPGVGAGMAHWAIAAAALTATPLAFATNVIIETSLGDIEVELFDEETPLTVANFLGYVRSGAYEGGLIHRSVDNFVIQGGAYTLIDNSIEAIPANPPVQNEPGISNTRGTIAMAKLNGQPNSATTSWFINVVDNTNLDTDNGGFTVFGRVVGDGMQVVDAINDLPTFNIGNIPGFSETPLRDFTGGEVTVDNFVFAPITEASDFVINAGLNDAWFDPDTSGQGVFFTVYPSIGQLFLSWFTYDTERPDDSASAELGEPGHRWLTAIGPINGNRADLDVTLTSGGVFDSPEPMVTNDSEYGTIEVTFENCDLAVIRYDLPGPALQGEVVLERVVKDNVALCEALQEPAETR